MGYIIDGKEYSYTSPANERILRELINREIYCCLTQEVEYMISRIWSADTDNPITEDDYLSLTQPACKECGSDYGFKEMAVSDLADDEIKTEEEYSFEDILNNEDGKPIRLYLCPICEASYSTLEEALDCCGQDSIIFKCLECGEIYSEDDFDRLENVFPEIYEWYAVSTWFGEKLIEQGCPVILGYGKSYWGRCSTGQSIVLDGCIQRIAKEMGILQGMEHDWSNKI